MKDVDNSFKNEVDNPVTAAAREAFRDIRKFTRMQIAVCMLDNGEDIDKVMRYTFLTRDEIEEGRAICDRLVKKFMGE